MSKQTILLVVGPDMCGKTNIIQEISKRTGIPSFKASSEHKAFLGDQKSFIDDVRHSDHRVVDLLKQTGYNVLFDRAYPCEFVYSFYFERETDLPAIFSLDEKYGALGAKILFCTRKSFDGIVDDLNPRLNGKELHRISEVYQEFLTLTHCKHHTLYVDDFDINRQVSECIHFLES